MGTLKIFFSNSPSNYLSNAAIKKITLESGPLRYKPEVTWCPGHLKNIFFKLPFKLSIECSNKKNYTGNGSAAVQEVPRAPKNIFPLSLSINSQNGSAAVQKCPDTSFDSFDSFSGEGKGEYRFSL